MACPLVTKMGGQLPIGSTTVLTQCLSASVLAKQLAFLCLHRFPVPTRKCQTTTNNSLS